MYCQIIDGGEARLSLHMMSEFDKELDVSNNYERPPKWQKYSAQQLLRFFDGEMFFSHRQIVLIMRSLHASLMFERQVCALLFRTITVACCVCASCSI
jgi:hypothetical protein